MGMILYPLEGLAWITILVICFFGTLKRHLFGLLQFCFAVAGIVFEYYLLQFLLVVYVFCVHNIEQGTTLLCSALTIAMPFVDASNLKCMVMPTIYLLIPAMCQEMENYFWTACSLAVRMLRWLYQSALYCLDSFQIPLHFAQVLMS